MLHSVTTCGLCTQCPHLLLSYALNTSGLKGPSLQAPTRLSEQPCDADIMVPI